MSIVLHIEQSGVQSWFKSPRIYRLPARQHMMEYLITPILIINNCIQYLRARLPSFWKNLPAD